MRQGRRICTWLCACKSVAARSRRLGLPPSRNSSQSWARRAEAGPWPRAIIAFRLRSPATDCTARAASPIKSPAASRPRRSTTWSPMATPGRGQAEAGSSAVVNMPRGRFWSGKSVSPAQAEASQLRCEGSCVAFKGIMGRF